MRRALGVVIACALTSACSSPSPTPAPSLPPAPSLAPTPSAAPAPSVAPVPSATPVPVVYPLDDFPRHPELVADGCPDIPLVDHVGAPAPWEPALRVHPTFEPAVVLLEEAIRDTAREVYGHDPARLLSASSYRCTTVRRRPERISEHALGNAIDLRGIVLDDGTETSVTDHWHAHAATDAVHARFWRMLVEHVRDRAIFRGILGPPARDHTDHLHFDRGPSSFFDLELDDGTVTE